MSEDFDTLDLDPDEPVQEHAWSEGTCYGCGPANADGLQLKSHLSEDEDRLEATFEPDAVYNAGDPNTLYGGLIASLIDCHSMWTAITFAHIDADRPLTEERESYVTSELEVDYRKPTPIDRSVHLESWIEDDRGREKRVACELGPVDEVTAVGDVLAVRVRSED